MKWSVPEFIEVDMVWCNHLAFLYRTIDVFTKTVSTFVFVCNISKLTSNVIVLTQSGLSVGVGWSGGS